MSLALRYVFFIYALLLLGCDVQPTTTTKDFADALVEDPTVSELGFTSGETNYPDFVNERHSVKREVLANFSSDFNYALRGNTYFYKQFTSRVLSGSSHTRIRSIWEQRKCHNGNTYKLWVSTLDSDPYKTIQCHTISDSEWNRNAGNCQAIAPQHTRKACLDVRLPPGRTTLRKPIAINRPNVRIVGANLDSTLTFRKQNYENEKLTGRGLVEINADSVTLRRFTLKWQHAVQHGVVVGKSNVSAQNTFIHHMVFTDRSRIWVNRTNGLAIKNSFFDVSGSSAMVSLNGPSYNVVVYKNTFGRSSGGFTNEAIDIGSETKNMAIIANTFNAQNTDSAVQREEIIDVGVNNEKTEQVRNLAISQNKFYCRGRSNSAIFLKQKTKNVVIESNDFARGGSCSNGQSISYKETGAHDCDFIYDRGDTRLLDVKGTIKFQGNVHHYSSSGNNRRQVLISNKYWNGEVLKNPNITHAESLRKYGGCPLRERATILKLNESAMHKGFNIRNIHNRYK